MARPSQPLISKRQVGLEGLRLVDEGGLELMTLDRLAVALGVRAPSLYNHFTDKSDVLTSIARALLSDIPLPSVPEPERWREWFEELCLSTYRHVLHRPRAAPLLIHHFPRSLIFPAHDRGSGLLLSAGIPVSDVAVVLRGLEKLTFGLIVADAAELVAGTSERQAVSPDDWPAYSAALAANQRDNEALFVEAISAFLDGVGARFL